MDHPSGTAVGQWPGPRPRACGCMSCCVSRSAIADKLDAEIPTAAVPTFGLFLCLTLQ